MAKIVRRTTTSIVADELRIRILNGEIKEGDQVRQEAVANELGVSRIPVREALRLLEAEGLITLVSHKGAVVTSLEPSEIEELFEIRTMLEVWAFEQAIGHIPQEDFDEAEFYLEQMREETPSREWGPLNWSFHSALYRAANKPATITILKRVHDSIDRYIRLQINLSEDAQREAHEEHEAILKAARDKDANRGTALLSAHINKVKEQLLQSVIARKKASA